MKRWAYLLWAATGAGSAAILLLFFGPQVVGQAEKPPAPTLAALTQPIDVLGADNEGLRKALEKRVTLDLQATPLFKAVDAFAAQLDVDVHLDPQGLQNAMVDRNSPITLKVRGLRARNAVALMLEPLNLVCTPLNGVLQVTDQDSTRKINIVRVYPVADLAVVPERLDTVFLASLIGALQETVDRDVWEANGGDATIRFFEPSLSLVVNCPEPIHERVDAVLTGLRISRTRLADLLITSKLPSAKEIFTAPATTQPDQAAASADKVAAEAKGIAEAALQIALRLEMQLSQKQSPLEPTQKPSVPLKKN